MSKATDILKFLTESEQVIVRLQVTEGPTSAMHDPSRGKGNIIVPLGVFEDALEEVKELEYRMESLEK